MRNVYYDPFGMRLEGYRAGVGDEVQLQDQTRRARASDWDFANVKPLELETMQRENTFQNWFDPYRRTAARGGVYDQELNRAGQFGLMTGVDAPLQDTMFNYFQPSNKEQQHDEFGNPIGQPIYYYDDGLGGQRMYQYNPRNALDYLMFDRNQQLADQSLQESALGLQRDQLGENIRQFDGTLPIQQGNLDVQRFWQMLRQNTDSGVYSDGFGP